VIVTYVTYGKLKELGISLREFQLVLRRRKDILIE